MTIRVENDAMDMKFEQMLVVFCEVRSCRPFLS